ncbi:MAG: bifunctional riboflavin kinase/FAD synthetase [bacterium]
MEIIYGLENWVNKYTKIAVALGNFDGVHLGHQRIIATTCGEAKAMGGIVMAMTFEPHPTKAITGESTPVLLTTTTEKAELLRKLGVDVLLMVNFNEAFANIEPEEFISQILHAQLQAQTVVVGFNYRFGRKAAGNTVLLEQKCNQLGIKVNIVPPVIKGGQPISSTLIRKLLHSGRLKEASHLLGRFYGINGRVVHGAKRGRHLGFPTANLSVTEGKVLPACGVYLVRCFLGEYILYGVANVGRCPTFGNKEIGIEIHLLDFKGKLYDQKVKVEFLEFLRSEKHFASSKQLQAQIAADVQLAQRIWKYYAKDIFVYDTI